MADTTTTTQDTIDSLEEQNLALLFIVGASGISLVANEKLIIYTKYGKNAPVTIDEIQKMAELSALILLVVAIYFAIVTQYVYEQHPTIANRNYLVAAYLTLGANAIRFYTLRKYPNSFSGVEDLF